MKIWLFNKRTSIFSRFFCTACLLAGLLAAGITVADGQTNKSDKASPIHITADKMVNDAKKRTVIFTGNVRVVQGETTISADNMVLYYGDGDSGTSTGTSGGNNIDTIEARGNVRIEMDNRIAESDKAVYTTKNKLLVLSGPGAKVISGPDVIEGSVITFDRETGNVKIVGDGDNQVKAIIRSDQMGLN